MTALADHLCEVCRSGAPAVGDDEMPDLLREIPQWQVVVDAGVRQLQRRFDFANFREAMDFANQIAALADAENHHPTLQVEWAAVEVAWWTHKIRAPHKNDFIMAAKTDRLFNEQA